MLLRLSTGTVKSKFGLYFWVLYTFYVKMQHFTRVRSLQSIIQAARRTPTHQLQALRACTRAWLQVMGLGKLLLWVPVRDPPAGACPGSPDARLGSAARPPSAPDPSTTDARRARGCPNFPWKCIGHTVHTHLVQLGTVFDRNILSMAVPPGYVPYWYQISGTFKSTYHNLYSVKHAEL